MKYLLGFIVMMVLSLQGKAQTCEGFENFGSNYTCYYLDSNNVHCYAEDSDADLDLDNDGVLDREYIFSTPEKDKDLEGRELNDKGVIRNRQPEFYEEELEREDTIEGQGKFDSIEVYPEDRKRDL